MLSPRHSFLKVLQTQNKCSQPREGSREWIESEKKNAHPIQLPALPSEGVGVEISKRQTREKHKTKSHAKPCLVICAVKFDQCEYVGDRVSEAQNGSHKKYESAVPLKFVYKG
ncbi:hypothetical protein ACROYT_G040275 [Oculina patagonica]